MTRFRGIPMCRTANQSAVRQNYGADKTPLRCHGEIPESPTQTNRKDMKTTT